MYQQQTNTMYKNLIMECLTTQNNTRINNLLKQKEIVENREIREIHENLKELNGVNYVVFDIIKYLNEDEMESLYEKYVRVRNNMYKYSRNVATVRMKKYIKISEKRIKCFERMGRKKGCEVRYMDVESVLDNAGRKNMINISILNIIIYCEERYTK